MLNLKTVTAESNETEEEKQQAVMSLTGKTSNKNHTLGARSPYSEIELGGMYAQNEIEDVQSFEVVAENDGPKVNRRKSELNSPH